MKPTEEEKRFLGSAYNFFYDIYEEVAAPGFWDKDSYYRFSRIRDAFLVYSEIIEYEPIVYLLKELKKSRPPMEAEIAHEFFLFIRNALIHFPFFKTWEEVKLQRTLVNWSKPGRTMDKFLTKYSGRDPVKYRLWNPKEKKFVYVTIAFPGKYLEDTEMSLSSFMPEKEGFLFSLALMKSVLDSQVEP